MATNALCVRLNRSYRAFQVFLFLIEELETSRNLLRDGSPLDITATWRRESATRLRTTELDGTIARFLKQPPI